MTWTQIEQQWLAMSHHAQVKWSKLTQDDLKVVEGRRDRLIGKVHERYGCRRVEAEKQVDEWFARIVPLPPTLKVTNLGSKHSS